MQYSLIKSSLLASSLLLTTNAWPLAIPPFNYPVEKRAPASYSVVAVDGGSATANTPPTATVTNLVTRTQLLTTTQIATSILTDSNQPTTIYLTNTITIPTTIVETPAAAIPTPPASVAAASSPLSSAPNAYTFITVTITNPTQQQQQPPSAPYDNGMWHTTYFYTVPTETSTPAATSTPSLPPPPPSSPVTSSSAVPTFDNGQWHPPSGWNATWGGRR